MITRRASLALALVGLLAAVTPASAQRDERLSARLDAGTAASVQRAVDAATAAGLPTEPLVLKALEGASKGARGPQIVAAVGRLRGQLLESRTALGAGSSSDEIVAGAAALQAGVQPSMLRTMRAARSEPLTTALSVVSDLVTRGVPAEAALEAVVALLRAGAADQQFIAFQQAVDRDIVAGLPPIAAVTARARGGPPATVPTSPGARPTPPSGGGRPPTP